MNDFIANVTACNEKRDYRKMAEAAVVNQSHVVGPER
jgi:hypothetical protein